MKKQIELWPTSAKPEIILYHEDFDGICSAAVLKKFFGNSTKFDPVSYRLKRSWLRKDISHAAVLDFLFHPQAIWWFDHHTTSFIDERTRSKYVPDSRHRWDLSYSSCPPLILDVLSETNDVTDLRDFFREWLIWSNMIDSANYKNPDQAVKGTEPGILINQALSESRDKSLRNYIVEKIFAGLTPSSIAEDSIVSPKWKEFRRKQEIALSHMQKNLQLIGNVCLCNSLDTGIPFVRYGVYYFQPNVDFSLITYSVKYGKNRYFLSLSKNPWIKNNTNINLGLIASRYGGGGRENVASVAFSSKSVCWKGSIEIAKHLNSKSGRENGQ